MIQNVFSVVGDVEIFPAVVVVVADANALAPTGVGEAGFFRDVGEGAVVIVVVEMACGQFSRGGRIEACAVNDEDVGPAVVIIVKDATPVPVVSMMYFLVSTPPKTTGAVRPAFFAISVK